VTVLKKKLFVNGTCGKREMRNTAAAAALALGCFAGAGWWWVSSRQKVDVRRTASHETSHESTSPPRDAPGKEGGAEADALWRAATPGRQRQAPPTPPPADQRGTPPPGVMVESSYSKTGDAPTAPTTPTTAGAMAQRRKELVAAAARRKEAATSAAAATPAVADVSAQELVRRGPADDAARATAEWAAMHAEGWRGAAAEAEERASGQVPRTETWISCRAARAANSKRAGAGAADGDAADDMDFESGVWSVEDEDRFSGAGGRELTEAEMQDILKQDSKALPEFWRNKYEADARRCWDRFYNINKTNFFKDRHYLDREWPELKEDNIAVLDLGCGVGNTTLPLLQLNPSLKLWSCDFSPNAVALMQQSEGFDSKRCTAFVNDITSDPLTHHVASGSIDKCLLIFVLSAINPDMMVHSLQNLAAVMKPGGRVLFRDYGIYDMAEIRLAEQKGHKISENFYVRKDGTRAYYFSEEKARQVFEEAGFEPAQLIMHRCLSFSRTLLSFPSSLSHVCELRGAVSWRRLLLLFLSSFSPLLLASPAYCHCPQTTDHRPPAHSREAPSQAATGG
jgi:methyltransferase-like protein 6